MTQEEQMAYGLLAIAGNEALLKPKLDELIKRREDAEEIEARNYKERQELQKLKEDTNLHVAQQTDALNKAKAEHDDAALEAHKRITMAQEQEEKLKKLKADLDYRQSTLSAAEVALEKNTTMHNAQVAKLGSAINDIPKLKAALDEINSLATGVKEKLG